MDEKDISRAVIQRLPRYYRYLGELLDDNVERISSNELSSRMKVTASQIRQDLNNFGGFGQQGYGYNVNYLYAKISEILGVGEGYRAIIIGAGNLGRALVRNRMFERRGVDTVAMFDIDANVIGKEFGGAIVYNMTELEKFCEENVVDIAVLTLPKEFVNETVARLESIGIPGLWNFTGKELVTLSQTVCEDVHLGDSLMTLCYELRSRSIKAKFEDDETDS